MRTRRTRTRILAESLRQFNDNGAAHVTTGAIADSLGMSPGNLYYHYRNKDAIVEELFGLFATRLDSEGAPPADAGAAVEDLWLSLHLMLEGVWDFRFLFRSLGDLLARNRRLREPFNRLMDRKHDEFVRIFQWLVERRAMRAQPDEVRALAHNVLVVATYWLDFESIRSRGRPACAEGPGRGAFQVMSLVAPYLSAPARAHLDGLAARYLE